MPAPKRPEQQRAPLPEASPIIMLLPKASFSVSSDRGVFSALELISTEYESGFAFLSLTAGV